MSSKVLLPLRLYYAGSFAALGALFPYLPPILGARGLAPEQIRWVLVMLPLANMLLPPLWGALADALQARVAILRAASLGCAIAVLLLFLSNSFYTALVTFLLFSAFRAPLIPVGDAVACSALAGKGVAFGRIRLWGSVGFGLAVLALGLASGTSHQGLLFGISASLYLLASASTLLLPASVGQRQHGVLRQAFGLLRQPFILVFLLGNVLHYLGHSTYDAYFSRHVKALGHGDPVVGLGWAVGVAVEVGVMQALPRFERPGGRLLCLGAAAAGVRWWLLSLATDWPALIGIQVLHGLSFGLWYVTMVRWVQVRTPEHLRATLQTAAHASLGCGTVAGYLFGGRVLQTLGGQALFRRSSLAAVGSALLYGVLDRVEARSPRVE